MSPMANFTRRRFIEVVGAATGGLVLALRMPFADDLLADAPVDGAHFQPNIWLRIDTDGAVTITVARSEMGQGARTAMVMLVAEELEADWSAIRVEQALAAPEYGNMTTGGSSSVRGSWEHLRKAGAAAREMLVAAAAAKWGVDPSTCRAENGAVVHTPTDRRLEYGALADAAARLPVPEEPRLKDPQDFRLIGTNVPRLDTPEKVVGRARFGIDTRPPDALVAVVARCDVFGGTLERYDGSHALAVPGVRQVVEIPSGVAVVASSTWAAMRGREALEVEWDRGPNARLSSDAIRREFTARSREPGEVARHDGDPETALARAAKRLEAVYEVPFLAHAPLEPMNCLADVHHDKAEIWAPTQAPQWARQAVAEALELAVEQVIVHTTYSGGAFGRRIMPDFAVEAAQISKLLGAPTQVVWTREDDMRHDFYRPASLHRLAAGLDAEGRLVAWTHRVVAPSIGRQVNPNAPRDGSPDVVSGAADLAYRIPNLHVDFAIPETPVPLGWWRSVYHSQHAFVNECFLDEIAAAAGSDPYQFRRQLLPRDSRLRRALEHVAQKAGWGRASKRGTGRGLACHSCFGAYVAEVATVSVDDAGRVRVHGVESALDCGPIVHPDMIAAQFEGAIALALSAVLGGAITLAEGKVEQGNFDDYPPVDFASMPQVTVHILPSTDTQGGVGEPGLPPLAPAVCNAVFAATGKRIRRLPLRSADLRRT